MLPCFGAALGHFIRLTDVDDATEPQGSKKASWETLWAASLATESCQ
jgi:hypothetical protein